jgi:ubiquitin carboxyl-terminal hydrolase 7
MEEFIGIQLPIEDCRNITESFERYCDKEILDGDNCIQTDEFGKQAAYKYHIFTSLPPVLFLNLKRYRYDMSKMAFEKINDRFEYQDTIDMLPFLSSKGVH